MQVYECFSRFNVPWRSALFRVPKIQDFTREYKRGTIDKLGDFPEKKCMYNLDKSPSWSIVQRSALILPPEILVVLGSQSWRIFRNVAELQWLFSHFKLRKPFNRLHFTESMLFVSHFYLHNRFSWVLSVYQPLVVCQNLPFFRVTSTLHTYTKNWKINHPLRCRLTTLDILIQKRYFLTVLAVQHRITITQCTGVRFQLILVPPHVCIWLSNKNTV